MALTTGRLGESRSIGGARAALRREIRRARRDDNTALANALGGRLAQENLARAEAGVSNINRAEDDIYASRAQAATEAILNRERAQILAEPSTPPPTTITPRPGGFGEPRQSGGRKDVDGPPADRRAPVTQSAADPSPSATAPRQETPAGFLTGEPAGLNDILARQAPAFEGARPAPDPEPRVGRINGIPARDAISQASQAAAVAVAGAGSKPTIDSSADEVEAYAEYLERSKGREAAMSFRLQQAAERKARRDEMDQKKIGDVARARAQANEILPIVPPALRRSAREFIPRDAAAPYLLQRVSDPTSGGEVFDPGVTDADQDFTGFLPRFAAGIDQSVIDRERERAAEISRARELARIQADQRAFSPTAPPRFVDPVPQPPARPLSRALPNRGYDPLQRAAGRRDDMRRYQSFLERTRNPVRRPFRPIP